MKVRIEIDEGLKTEEVIIRCRSLSEEIEKIQRTVSGLTESGVQLVFYKGETEFYFPLKDILFFETVEGGIQAHTLNDIFRVKYRLYELETILPRTFIRISKSSILNIEKVYSVERNLTASSIVQFQNSHKQVYVSRYYYKSLKIAMEERIVRSAN